MSGAARVETGARTRPGSRVVLVVCLATGLATLFDSAVLVVAAPTLRAELGASPGHLQWILAGYSLTFGLALIPAGRLGDLVGRTGLLAAGLALFSLASVLGATSSDPGMLVVARLLQGVGAGTANPQVIGLMQDHFAGPARARALGAYMSVGSAAALLAPLVGGAVLQAAGPDLGWRLVVLLNVPLGLTALSLCLVVLHRHRPRRRLHGRPDVDPVGLTLLTALTLALLVPVVAPPREPLGWTVVTVAGVALTVGVAVWERRYARRGRLALMTPELARAPGFVLGCVVATFTFGSHLGYAAVLMVFLQDAVGLGPLAAGVVTIPGAIASLVTSNLAWRLLRRWGRAGVSVVLGVKVVMAAGLSVLLVTSSAAWVVPVLVAAQLVTGAASGLAGPPNQALALEHAPADQRGVAAGVLQVSQRISATVCIAGLVGAYAAVVGREG